MSCSGVEEVKFVYRFKASSFAVEGEERRF